jgi:hypothetical protein
MLRQTRGILRAGLVGVVLACVGCGDREERSNEGVVRPETPAAAEPAAAPAGDFAVPDETARGLEALGYFPRAPTDNPEDRGVTANDAEAARGVNVYGSRHRARARLTDREGTVLHTWEANDEDAKHGPWMHVEPLPGGDLLVLTKDHDVAKIDWASSVVWRRELRVHHDVAIHPDGRLFVLVHDRREHTWRGREIPVLADAVAVLSPDGELLRTIELLPLLASSLSPRRLDGIVAALDTMPLARILREGGVADVLHTNSIAFLERDIPNVAPRGSVLLSFRAINRVMILSPEMTEVLWTWGAGELQQQHDATQLANGNVLIFDNGVGREKSRVIEVSPANGEIVWSYDPGDLFSRLRGGAQELPNGNILTTESDRGHALEVTRDGEKVWEFWNPDVRGTPPERAVIYRLNRFPRSFFGDRLEP